MKSKLLKIGVTLLTIMITLSNLIVFAGDVDITGTFNGEIPGDLNGAAGATREILGMILDIIRTIGIGIALIMLTYIGIKFMLASPNERANIKQYSMNFIIGAFILVGGVGVLTIIKNYAVDI